MSLREDFWREVEAQVAEPGALQGVLNRQTIVQFVLAFIGLAGFLFLFVFFLFFSLFPMLHRFLGH